MIIPLDQPLSAQTPKRPITTLSEDSLLLWHRLHIFPRLARVTYFHALHPSEPRFHATSNMLPGNIGSSYMLSCVLSRERRFHFALALFGSSRPSLHFLTIILKSLSNVDCFDTKFLEIFGVNNKLMGTITW